MKQGKFKYLKRFKYVQFVSIDGKYIHTLPLDGFSMALEIVKDDPDDPEFKFYFASGIRGRIEVDGVTYHEAEEFLATGV